MAAAPPDPPSGQGKELLSVVEQLSGLDAKLDGLSRQMVECLSRMQGLTSAVMHPSMYEPSCAPYSSQDSCRAGAPAAKESCLGGQCVERPRSPEKHHPAMRETLAIDLFQSSMTTSSCRNTPVWRPNRFCSSILMCDEVLPHRRTVGPVQLNVWKFLSNPESSLTAGIYNRLNCAFILLAVLLNMVQRTSLRILSPDAYAGVECSIEAFFLLEISTLFAVCPYRRYFLLKFYNVIDILSALPLALRVCKITTGGDGEFYTVIFEGFVPVVRLLKAVRHFQTSRLLANAFILAREAVPVLVYYYVVMWLLFTAIIYAVEERSNIKSLPDAMWLTAVTMTTIGYGDVIPVSGPGKMATASLVMVSTLYMAIPLGIIGSCFSTVWDDRDKILLFERLRTCFMEVGCSDLDVPRLFSRYDKTKTGSLDALEFIHMCASLKLGLSQERVMMLFNFWANEGDGRIEATTFQQVLFPRECLKMLEKQAQEQDRAARRIVGPSDYTAPSRAFCPRSPLQLDD